MKKKFTMLFAALLAFVGVAKAQPAIETSTAETPKYYVIASYSRGGFLTNAGVGNGLTHVALTDAAYWYFEEANGGGVYIVNKTLSGENKVYVGSDRKASTTPAVWYIVANGVNNAGLSISSTETISSESCIDANNHNEGVGSWAPNAGDWQGTTWVVSEYQNLVGCVYNFEYNATNKGSETAKVATAIGYEFPAITTSFPFGILTPTKPAGNIAEGDVVDGTVTKTITLEDNLPFTYAADYASIENWYYLIFHANQRNYLYYTQDNAVLMANKTVVDASDKNAYTWAFVGNPFDGFKVYNKKAQKFLDAAESGAVVADGEQVFKLTASPSGTNGFYMQASDGSYTQRFNKSQGTSQVVYWSGADAGSTFMVELRDDSEQLKALVNSASELLTNLGEGTAVGCVTADSKADVVAAIASANTAIENKTGYEAAEIALQAAINALETIQPEEGKFYTIVSSCTNDHRAGQEIYMNTYGRMQFAKVGEVADEIARVFQFVPATDGKFYIYNVENGVYMHTVGYATATTASEAKPVTITNMGSENIVKIVPNGQNMMHAQDNGSVIVGWNENSYTDGSAWKIVETALSLNDLTHTLTVTEAGWATLVLGYNTTIPAEVKAYAVSNIAEGKAVLAEVADVLPAHTPVLIEAAAGDYVFEYTATEATVETNLLKGSVFNLNVSEDGYVLANGANGVGLYKAAYNVSTNTTNDGEEGVEDDTYEAFLNNANKAYLPAPAGAAPAMFSFGRGEGTTGIETAVSGEQTVVIYDLAGRRVEKMEKGIYIINGKKVIR